MGSRGCETWLRVGLHIFAICLCIPSESRKSRSHRPSQTSTGTMVLGSMYRMAFVSLLVDARETATGGWGMALKLSRALPLVGCTSHLDDIAVDVGARGGGETRMALNAGYTVLAIECHAKAFRSFRAMYANDSRVHAHFGCASDHGGNATFHIAGDSSSLHEKAVTTRKVERMKRPTNGALTTTVPLLVVDDLLATLGGRVCAVKVDVQGNELGVFLGMVRTFARHRPVLYFEHAVVNLGDDAQRLIPWVQAQGYLCHPHVCEYCNVLCTPFVSRASSVVMAAASADGGSTRST